MSVVRQTMSNRCMPVPEWPAPDRAAWIAALQPDGTPDLSAVAVHWSEATRRMVRSGYGRWLTWLAEQELLDATTPPAERITTERLSSYIAALRTISPPCGPAASARSRWRRGSSNSAMPCG